MRRSLLIFILSAVAIGVMPVATTALASGVIAGLTVTMFASGLNFIRKGIISVFEVIRGDRPIFNTKKNQSQSKEQKVEKKKGPGLVERINKFAEGIQERASKRLEQKTKENMYCDAVRGNWKNLPADMHPVVSGDKNGEATFKVDGSPRLITSYRSQDTNLVEFGFGLLSKENAARALSEIESMQLKDKLFVYRNDHTGDYCLKSNDAGLIKMMAQKLFPPVSFDIERVVTSVNQYCVFAPTYEDALRIVEESKKNGNPLKPSNSYIHTKDIIDGKDFDKGVDGSVLRSEQLGFGVWVVDESVKSVSNSVVTVDSAETKDLDNPALLEVVSSHFYDGEVKRNANKSIEEPYFSNGLEGQSLNRNMSLDERNTVELVRSSEVTPEKTFAIIRCSSYEDFQAVVSGEKSMAGHMILLDDELPVPNGNEYIISVPVDKDFLTSARFVGNDINVLMNKYGEHISFEDANASLLMRDLKSNGYTSARMNAEIDFSKATVNGALVSDVLEREDLSVVPSLKGEQEKLAWLNDAASIKSVDMFIDTKKCELVVKSSISNNNMLLQKEEHRSLTPEEIYDLSGRSNSISNAEMKDVIMRLYPDYFKSYHNESGNPLFEKADTLNSFIHSTVPVGVSSKKKSADVKKENGNGLASTKSEGQKKSESSVKKGTVKKVKIPGVKMS